MGILPMSSLLLLLLHKRGTEENSKPRAGRP
jgi:hypothetical protein